MTVRCSCNELAPCSGSLRHGCVRHRRASKLSVCRTTARRRFAGRAWCEGFPGSAAPIHGSSNQCLNGRRAWPKTAAVTGQLGHCKQHLHHCLLPLVLALVVKHSSCVSPRTRRGWERECEEAERVTEWRRLRECEDVGESARMGKRVR